MLLCVLLCDESGPAGGQLNIAVSANYTAADVTDDLIDRSLAKLVADGALKFLADLFPEPEGEVRHAHVPAPHVTEEMQTPRDQT